MTEKMFLYEIDGVLETEGVCTSLTEAKNSAKSSIEDNRDTEANVIIYKLKPVLHGDLTINVNWETIK